MCGILGFTGDANADPGKIRVLLLENESRGAHSTGIYGKRMMKKAVSASTFLEDANFDYIATSNVVIGHTRYSTGTAKTKENAHPFEFGHKSQEGHIVGVHNGSIFNEHEAEQKIKGFTRGNVDSESIFKAIYQSGDRNIFSMFEGHMAIAFKLDGLLYLYRRESRPLFVGKTKAGWYFSSLKEGLSKLSIPEEKIASIQPNTLIGFKGSKMVSVDAIDAPRVKLQSHHTAYTWSTNVDAKLMEELTGKKPLPVVGAGQTGKTTITPKIGFTKEESHQCVTFQPPNGGTRNPYRVMSKTEINNSRLGIRGRNILIPESEIFILNEYNKFLVKNAKTICGKLKYETNYFDTDKGMKMWPQSEEHSFKSEITIMPQSINKIEDDSGNSHKKIKISIHTSFLVSRRGEPATSYPCRESLYLLVKLDKSDIRHDSLSIGVDKAIFSSPICDYVKNVGGYVDFEIPVMAYAHLISTRATLRIAYVDIRTPGFMWETTISVFAGGSYSFKAVLDISAENDFKQLSEGKYIGEKLEVDEKLSRPVAESVLKYEALRFAGLIGRGYSSELFVNLNTDLKEQVSMYQSYVRLLKKASDDSLNVDEKKNVIDISGISSIEYVDIDGNIKHVKEHDYVVPVGKFKKISEMVAESWDIVRSSINDLRMISESFEINSDVDACLHRIINSMEASSVMLEESKSLAKNVTSNQLPF